MPVLFNIRTARPCLTDDERTRAPHPLRAFAVPDFLAAIDRIHNDPSVVRLS